MGFTVFLWYGMTERKQLERGAQSSRGLRREEQKAVS